MGYTHYWTFNRAALSPAELEKGFALAAKEIRSLKQYLPKEIKIRNGLGIDQAVIEDDEIWFNGDNRHDLSHETFHVKIGDSLDPALTEDFCKTARKPYDILVCCALISLKRHLPGAFSFTSDGDRSDWATAIKFYDRNLGASHAVNHTAHL